MRLRASLVACLLSGGLASFAGLTSQSACTNATVYNIDLVSGISINTALLLENGDIACSADSSQAVYKYVAVVINDAGDIGGAGIFDCFSDGIFANLPGTDGGALNFAVWIYAYNPQDYAAAVSKGLVQAVQLLNGVTQVDGSVIPVSDKSVPDGGLFGGPLDYKAKLSTICRTKATWTATCSATSQASVLNQAFCGPLMLETSAPSACSLPVLLPEGGVATQRHD